MANNISDSAYAFNEQWKDIENRYNPKIVTLEKVAAPASAIAKIEFSLDISRAKSPTGKHSPKFTVHEEISYDSNHRPIPYNLYETDKLKGEMLILPGFPAVRPKVKFLDNALLQHINVYPSGSMCIGDSDQSVLSIIFDNIFRACVYDPDYTVANYGSMANRAAENWQRSKTASGEFPIINPTLLFRSSSGTLPPPKQMSSLSRTRVLPPVRR